jgi:hypothetical protein
VADRVLAVTGADCELVGAGDGSVLVYCKPCHRVLVTRATTLNAVLGFWEEHTDAEHMVCGLCYRVPAEGESHRHLYTVGDTGEDAEEVCVGADRHQLDYAPAPPGVVAPYVPAPDPWTDPDAAAAHQPPPF